VSACVAAHGCITCGDVATTMRVLEVDRERGLALCAAPDGRRASVEIALVEPVALDETLLVHAGTALGRATDPDPSPLPTAEQAPGPSPDPASLNAAEQGAHA
jgi:hypothetical protein